jgi:citrate-Mg2+:H+ or citrate-Ca2+:H+ symporter, CitMHS family
MLSVIAFLTLLAVVVLLTTGRVSPVICLAIVPIIGALAAGFTDPTQLARFFADGTHKVLSVVIMFIFAILFFGVMNDAGLFDPVIDRVVALTRGNVVSACIATVVVGAIAHLDGSGASTFLIAIPPLLPLYRRLRMDPYLLILLVGVAASIINMVPWGGPLGRVAAVLKMDPTALWRPLIPLQIIGLVMLVGMAVLLGLREQRRIAARGGVLVESGDTGDLGETHFGAVSIPSRDRRPLITWFNRMLTLATIGVLVWGIIPPEMIFMIASSIALLVNFPNAKDQMDRIKSYSPSALTMAAILLAAGSFLGMLEGTGMLTSLAKDLVRVMPDFASHYLHIIIGVLGIPLELLFNTDAYFFGIVPVVELIVRQYGVDATTAAYPMIIGKVTGTFICPLAPALWLALGLANLEVGKYLRYSFLWYWGFGIVLLVVAMMLGIFSI